MKNEKITESESHISAIIHDENRYLGIAGLFVSAQERYGFDSMVVGETKSYDSASVGVKKSKLQSLIHSYAHRNGKRFRTKSVGNALHVMRTE